MFKCVFKLMSHLLQVSQRFSSWIKVDQARIINSSIEHLEF